MSAIHVALLGYGTVGKGVFQTVYKHQERLKRVLGKEVKIVAVLVKDVRKHQLPDDKVILTNHFEDIIGLEKLDVVIDAIVGLEPGLSYLQQSIQKGCHVITANKEMFAHHGSALQKLAKEYGVSIGFEATVAGGIPVIQTLKKLLNVNKVEKLQGILNGTSNFILTKMREENLSFTDALTIAQEKGYAEANPANDIEGFDAFYKAVILSEVIFGEQPDWGKTDRQGIDSITVDQINLFSSLGLRFKHVASLRNTITGIFCTVRPVLVSQSHPLYQVENVQNAINIEADIVGNISLQGPGAGMFPTASAIIEDLIHLGDRSDVPYFEKGFDSDHEQDKDSSIWALYGDANHTNFTGVSVQIFERIHPNVLLVEATEEEINSIKNQSSFSFFEILGEYEKLPESEKVFS